MVSFSDILTRLMFMTIGDYPLIGQLDEMLISQNMSPVVNGDAAPASLPNLYWPLSEAAVNIPVVNGFLTDPSTFYEMLNGTHQGVINPAIAVNTWGDSTAIVVISSNDLAGNNAMQMYTLAHMEFPAVTRAIPGISGVYTTYDGSTRIGAQQNVYTSNLYDVKINGPKESVLFVIKDRFDFDAVNPYVLQFPTGGGGLINIPGGVAGAGVDIAAGLFRDSPDFATQWENSSAAWNLNYGNTRDFRTSMTYVSEFLGRSSQPTMEVRDDQGNYTNRFSYYSVSDPYQASTPAGITAPLPLTEDDLFDLMQCQTTATGRLGQTEARTLLGNVTHTIYGSSGTARIARSMGWLIPLNESLPGGVVMSSELMSMPNVTQLVMNAYRASDLAHTLHATIAEKFGYPSFLKFPTAGYQVDGSYAIQKDASHYMSHATYSPFLMIPKSDINLEQGAVRDILNAAVIQGTTPYVTMDTTIYKQRYVGLTKENAIWAKSMVTLNDGKWSYKRMISGENNVEIFSVSHAAQDYVDRTYGYQFLRTDIYRSTNNVNVWNTDKNSMFISLAGLDGDSWRYVPVTFRSPPRGRSVYDSMTLQVAHQAPYDVPLPMITPVYRAVPNSILVDNFTTDDAYIVFQRNQLVYSQSEVFLETAIAPTWDSEETDRQTAPVIHRGKTIQQRYGRTNNVSANTLLND
jgi:hypothetical protein